MKFIRWHGLACWFKAEDVTKWYQKAILGAKFKERVQHKQGRMDQGSSVRWEERKINATEIVD
jgi:hypothetical protein